MMIRCYSLIIFLALLAVCVTTSSAMAACTSPPGADSQTRYDFVQHKMYVCNNSTWLQIPGGTGGGAGCMLDGVVVENGAAVDFYSATTHANCNSIKLSRTCTDGVLDGSGTYQYFACSAADTTPDAFSFNDVTGAALNTLTTPSPATVTISGIGASTPVSVSGDGSPQISINGGGWTTSGNITNGQTLAVRLTSANANGTARNATIDVGGVTDVWTVTTTSTDTTPDAFSFVDITAAGSTQHLSNIVQITGINGPATTGSTGGGNGSGWNWRSCSDAACSSVIQNWTTTGTVSNNQYVQVRLTTGVSGSTYTTLDVGGVSDTYTVTIGDSTPNAFSFTDQTGVALSTVTNSNIVQITGLTIAAPITVTGAASAYFRVCGDATCSTNPSWQITGTPGNILNNQYLQVRVTSSASNNTAVNINVTVGGVSDTWSVTTVAGCAGTSYGGYCWYMGTAGQSCDTVCASRGGCNSAGTVNYAGSGGNITNCRNVLDALGVLSFPDPPYNAASSNSGGIPVGCSSGTNTFDYWIYAPPTTTCAASYASSLRACACNS